jgi:SAM-dependent methyltransferase
MTADPFFAPYNEAFWKENGSHEHREAERWIAKALYDVLGPKAVVDVGCGTGQMLQYFADVGVQKLLGIESPHGILECQRLGILEAVDHIVAHDLRDGLPEVDFWPDLVVCCEVAEHLPKVNAEMLIRGIVEDLDPDYLAFSGAEPGATGTGHINEQELEYWEEQVTSWGTHEYDPDKTLEFQDRLRNFHGEMFHWAQNIQLYRRRSK